MIELLQRLGVVPEIDEKRGDKLQGLVMISSGVQGSHKLWKSWKTWKITKKVPCMEKSGNLIKKLNNHGKVMEFCENFDETTS